jgi:hypothetical protein
MVTTTDLDELSPDPLYRRTGDCPGANPHERHQVSKESGIILRTLEDKIGARLDERGYCV